MDNKNPFLTDDGTVVDCQFLDEGQFVGSGQIGDVFNPEVFPAAGDIQGTAPKTVHHVFMAGDNHEENRANVAEGGGPSSTTQPGDQGSSTIDDKITRLVEAVEKVVVSKSEFDDGKVDLRHVECFSGEGESSSVAINLKNFLQELEDTFIERNLTERQKLILAKQKLLKTARSTIIAQRPESFKDLVVVLNENFGGANDPHDGLLEQLKNYIIFPNQNFTQFAFKAKELAQLVASRLECDVKSKIIFDALAKGLLSNFKEHISTQSEVKVAIKEKDPDKLISTLKELTRTDPKCLIRAGAHNVNKIGQFKSPKPKKKTDCDSGTPKNDQAVEESILKCQLCNTTGHLAPSCPTLQQNNGRNPFSHQNYYTRPVFYNNPFSYGYYPPQQYQGRTPRYYQQHQYGPRYRNFAPSRQPHCRSPYYPAQAGRNQENEGNPSDEFRNSETHQDPGLNNNNDQVFS